MKINGLVVIQNKQVYHVFIPNGIQIGMLFMGEDGQVAWDCATLGAVCEAMAERWGIRSSRVPPKPVKRNG